MLRSVLLFVPLLLVFSAGYLALRPYYEPAAQRTASLITRHMDPPTWIDSGPGGHWRCHAQTSQLADRIVYRWNLELPHLVMLSLALVPALTLATPTTWRNRLRLTGLGIVLVFVSHVVAMAGLTRAMWCLTQSPKSFVCLTLLRLLYVSGQLFGAAIWGLLTWRYWFPSAGRPAA